MRRGASPTPTTGARGRSILIVRLTATFLRVWRRGRVLIPWVMGTSPMSATGERRLFARLFDHARSLRHGKGAFPMPAARGGGLSTSIRGDASALYPSSGGGKGALIARRVRAFSTYADIWCQTHWWKTPSKRNWINRIPHQRSRMQEK